MGLWIFTGLLYLFFVGYWHYWATVAKREHRWNRMGYCLERRDRLLVAGAVAGIATGVVLSV